MYRFQLRDLKFELCEYRFLILLYLPSRSEDWILSLEATLKIQEDPNDRIEATINYEEMYAICERYMQMKYLLLESLAYDIAHEIKSKHPIVEKIEVKLAKLNPPVGGKVDRAVVTIEL